MQPFAVLGHFEGRGGNTAGVGRLAGQEEHAVCLKVISCFCSRRHIGAFRHGHDAVCHQSLGILEREFVLRRTGKCYITLHAPYALTLMVLGIRAVVPVLGQPLPLDFFDFLECCHVNAIGIIDPAGGIGTGDDLCAQLMSLFDGIDRNIAGAGYADSLACDRLAMALQHLINNVEQAVAGGFRSRQ